MAEDEGSSVESTFEEAELAPTNELPLLQPAALSRFPPAEEARLALAHQEQIRLYYNPRLRKDVPRLKEGVEYVDLSELDNASPVPPLYEFTHSYVDKVVLKCSSCSKWAIVNNNLPSFRLKPGPGDRGYHFKCSACGGGKQFFEHTEKTWLDITITCLYNMELIERDKSGERFFHVRKEICKLADEQWDVLCKGRSRTATWWATLNAQITTRLDLFETNKHGSGRWALIYSNISHRTPFELVAVAKPIKIKRQNDADLPASEHRTKGKHSQMKSSGGHNTATAASGKEDSTSSKVKRKKAGNATKELETRIQETTKSHTLPPASAAALIHSGVNSGHNTDDEDSSVSRPGSPRRKGGSVWCHQCKLRHEPSYLVHCDSTVRSHCGKLFCKGCIDRHYPDEKLDPSANVWTCIYCRKGCNCASCRRRKDHTVNHKGIDSVDFDKIQDVIARIVRIPPMALPPAPVQTAGPLSFDEKMDIDSSITTSIDSAATSPLATAAIPPFATDASASPLPPVIMSVLLKTAKPGPPSVWVDLRSQQEIEVLREFMTKFEQGQKLKIPLSAPLFHEAGVPFYTTSPTSTSLSSSGTEFINSAPSSPRQHSPPKSPKRKRGRPPKEKEPRDLELSLADTDSGGDELDDVPATTSTATLGKGPLPRRAGEYITSASNPNKRQKLTPQAKETAPANPKPSGKTPTALPSVNSSLPTTSCANLKILIDHGILHPGEALFFLNQGEPGILQSDGTIRFANQSLSSAAKFAKQSIQFPTSSEEKKQRSIKSLAKDTTSRACWNTVYIRGQPLQHFRDIYERRFGPLSNPIVDVEPPLPNSSEATVTHYSPTKGSAATTVVATTATNGAPAPPGFISTTFSINGSAAPTAPPKRKGRPPKNKNAVTPAPSTSPRPTPLPQPAAKSVPAEVPQPAPHNTPLVAEQPQYHSTHVVDYATPIGTYVHPNAHHHHPMSSYGFGRTIYDLPVGHHHHDDLAVSVDSLGGEMGIMDDTSAMVAMDESSLLASPDEVADLFL